MAGIAILAMGPTLVDPPPTYQQRQQEIIVQPSPQHPQQLWGWKDNSGYIWEAPVAPGETPRIRAYQDGSTIFVFPHPPDKP